MSDRPETVLALYRPKPGRAEALLDVLRDHVPTLRRLGLATDAPVVLLRSPEDGTLVEVFEWRSADAMRRAHDTPEVMHLWDAIGLAADFVSLSDLVEAGTPFPHFERVAGVVR